MEERIVVADPVLDPQGYQRELLALLGTSDPLEVMEATPATFRQRTAGLPAAAVGRRPAPEEWSVAELLGHLWDAEIAYAFRGRAILAQDRPELIGYDQDAAGSMVALRSGTYTSVPINTMMQGTKRVDVESLYDEKRYRPLIRQVDGKPMFLY